MTAWVSSSAAAIMLAPYYFASYDVAPGNAGLAVLSLPFADLGNASPRTASIPSPGPFLRRGLRAVMLHFPVASSARRAPPRAPALGSGSGSRRDEVLTATIGACFTGPLRPAQDFARISP